MGRLACSQQWLDQLISPTAFPPWLEGLRAKTGNSLRGETFYRLDEKTANIYLDFGFERGCLQGKAKENRCDDVGAASGGNVSWRKPMIRGEMSPGGNPWLALGNELMAWSQTDLKVAVGAKPERVK